MSSLPPIKALYTDGACSGNPGPGGWGAVAYFENGARHELGGYDAKTTNNRMEMQAAIALLEFLHAQQYGQPVTLHTDSEYLKKGITQWISGWKRKGWKNSAGKPVLNKDLWLQLDTLIQQLKQQKNLQITWKYVRGHTGNEGNERCDAIARAFSHQQPIQLQTVNISASKSSQNPEASVIKNNGEPPSPKASAPALESYEETQIKGDPLMAEVGSSSSSESGRIGRLRDSLETLKVADEIAKEGYLITSAELADLMDVNASAVTSRGDYWAWRNWTVSRIRREGNQILWQIERIDE
ncbi:MAG: ribonuclease HI [Cyanobacteria bacterium J06628_6]